MKKKNNKFRYRNTSASGDANSNSAAMQAFFKDIRGMVDTQFGKQSAITDNLTRLATPIYEAGPNQYGFSAAEDATLRTGINDAATQATNSAINATDMKLAQENGGTSALTSGAAAQLKEQAQVLGAQAKGNAMNKVTAAGFQQGNENFLNAENVLSGSAQILNPTSYITGANEAGKNASAAIQQVDQANSSWMGILGGALNAGIGAAGMAFSPGGAGTKAIFG